MRRRTETSPVLSVVAAVCDLLLVAVSLFLSCLLMGEIPVGGVVPVGDVAWYGCIALGCQLVLSLCLPPLVSPSVRVDEIMSRCFNRGLLLFVCASAVFSFAPNLRPAHSLMALTAAFSAVLMFVEWILWRLGLRLAHDDEEEDDEGETSAAVSPQTVRLGVGERLVKRCFDIVGTLLFLLTVFPVVYALMFFVTKLGRRGPVYTVARRRGEGGRVFGCLLFRRAGGGLAKLPMSLNVLAGDMSLVGPPFRGDEDDEATLASCRLRPGMASCLWRRAKEAGLRWEDANRWYARHWSFWLDVCIIMGTI